MCLPMAAVSIAVGNEKRAGEHNPQLPIHDIFVDG